MGTDATDRRRRPSGPGMAAGVGLGLPVGVVAWAASGEPAIGLLLVVATGTALGLAFERRRRTRGPLSPGARRLFTTLVVASLGLGLLGIGVILATV